MVTHDMAEALLLADRVVVVAAGRIAADAAPAELIRGHADPAVAAMIATPRRQAERLAALLRVTPGARRRGRRAAGRSSPRMSG